MSGRHTPAVEHESPPLVAFSCRYAPLPLIHAAGLVPYRVLPVSEAPDEAGAVLHENICPHVKRVVDRLVADDLPELVGVVMVSSCDAMRRLADAWASLRPSEALATMDLPFTTDEGSIAYLSAELSLLKAQLEAWSGAGPITPERIADSAAMYCSLSDELERIRQAASSARLPGGWSRLQRLRIRSVTEPPEQVLAELEAIEPDPPRQSNRMVPIYLFGNVLPDPEALDLLASCGAMVMEDDLCTGSRQIAPVRLAPSEDILDHLARAMLYGSPCARTMTTGDPNRLASELTQKAKASGARGVIAHVMKFCDPYLARMPVIRRHLEQAGLPLLVLEGDCTLRSLGQHRTRIEAFVEMLGTRPAGGGGTP
jgi:benzoyl-CoA reductase/2-hydroxyglutaryl-CoA dehydratase subunit BcrC/BadD/HgdB